MKRINEFGVAIAMTVTLGLVATAAQANHWVTVQGKKLQSHVVNWVSNNSSDAITISAIGAAFIIHINVDAASSNAISLTCANVSPVTVQPNSGAVCFIDDGYDVTWASTNAGGSATGSYEVIIT